MARLSFFPLLLGDEDPGDPESETEDAGDDAAELNVSLDPLDETESLDSGVANEVILRGNPDGTACLRISRSISDN